MKYAAITLAMLLTAPAFADELTVRTSLTFQGPLAALTPGFEAASGDKIKVAGANDPADLVILQKPQFDGPVKDGKVDAGSITDLARVKVGFAVKAGAPVPDISTPEKLKAVLLTAKSVGLSGAASGQYVLNEVVPKLGVAAEMKEKVTTINGAVGEAIAKGQVEVGFQQMSELLPIKGAHVVGRIPEALQRVTVVASGLGTDVQARAAAARFIAYVKSPAAAAVLKDMDLEAAK